MERIPEPEAKHLLTGEEPLVVLEYPEHLDHCTVEGIKAVLEAQGITQYLILTDGTTLSAVDEDTMRRLGWVRAPKEDGPTPEELERIQKQFEQRYSGPRWGGLPVRTEGTAAAPKEENEHA